MKSFKDSVMLFIMTALASQYYHAVYFDSGSSGFLNFQFMTLFEKASKDHYARARGQITRAMSAQGTTDNSIFQHFLSLASFAKCCAFAMSAAFPRELAVVKSQDAWTKLVFDPNASSAAPFFRHLHEFNETHPDFWEFRKSHAVITKI
ncbi:MAG: hypothetical protein WCR21_04315 [Bacteroidota bacterium]